MTRGRRRLAVAGLYAGGFLGPFAGGVTASMLPELGAAFHVSASQATATITAYLVPFAALMMFSGTWGARWGPRRSVLLAYLVYVAASVLCACAGSFTVLLAGRVVQGAANAFTTPLLLATIAANTADRRLGRALGLFGSLQAVGQTSAPLVGGLAAEISWRLAFVGVAVAAAVLAAVGLPSDAEPSADAGPVRLRAAWRPEVVRTAVVALAGWGCLGGLTFLVALRVDDAFALGAGPRGLLLTAFGVVGILTARVAGLVIERIGGRRAAVVGSLLGAAPVALIGVLPSALGIAALWAVGGFCAQFMLVGLNTMVLSGAPTGADNRAGAVSVVQAFRFVGAALSPVVFTPLYQANHAAGFLLPAALLAVTAPVLLRGDRER